MLDLVITVDWSAEQGRKPSPQENRCWLAWGTPLAQSEPEYMPTRLEAVDRVLEILSEHADARALVGFDFAIGYPTAEDGRAVLPQGRALCALMHQLVEDDASGNNNRFEVAAKLNDQIRQATGRDAGPFWGRPTSMPIAGVPVKRPSATGVKKLRTVERSARAASHSKPKSAWQLAGAGSVGGQSLVGLAAVHRLLESLGSRGHLWPFEPMPAAPNAATVAEIYPSLFEERSPSYWYKDARQVVDTRDAILDHPGQPSLFAVPRIAGVEGWILGVSAAAIAAPVE